MPNSTVVRVADDRHITYILTHILSWIQNIKTKLNEIMRDQTMGAVTIEFKLKECEAMEGYADEILNVSSKP